LTIPRDDELAAALATARRRRIGPFRPNPVDAEGARREIAMLARAGFPRDIVQTALQMASAAAESIVLQLKRR
jgi:regulatory protein